MPTTPDTPPPSSPEEYEAELNALATAVRGAFSAIAAAAPSEPLVNEIDSAAATVRASAQQLATVVPPTRYQIAHHELVTGLDELAAALSTLGDQVRVQELCAAQPVMATLATLQGTEGLRRTAGTFGTGGTALIGALEIGETLQDRGLDNGRVLRDPGSGYGEITVENGTDHDAVLTLSHSDSPVGSLYVGRGQTARLTDIPDGEYEVFFTSGVDWDGSRFTRSCNFSRFSETAQFQTITSGGQVQYTTFSMTLHPVAGGTASILPVSPDLFPEPAG